MNEELIERLERYEKWVAKVREIQHAPTEAEEILMRYPYGQPIRTFVRVMKRSRSDCEAALQHLEKNGKAEVVRLSEHAKVWRRHGMEVKD